MRACFLGQNICALGFGVAMLQTRPLSEEPHPMDPDESGAPGSKPNVDGGPTGPRPYIHSQFWSVSSRQS